MSVEELRAKLAEYRRHECSEDEHEGGECPVCNDIAGIVHEIRLATDDLGDADCQLAVADGGKVMTTCPTCRLKLYGNRQHITDNECIDALRWRLSVAHSERNELKLGLEQAHKLLQVVNRELEQMRSVRYQRVR